MYNKIAIIGVGLIGGSLALALKRSNFVKKVVGFARTDTARRKLTSEQIVDLATTNLKEAIIDADIVVLACPMGEYKAVFKRLSGFLQPNSVITDVGSVKGKVSTLAVEMLGDRASLFVPGHPIAGSEKSGSKNASPNLFKNHSVILTRSNYTDSDALEKVASMWQATGAIVKFVSPEVHDRILASTSHLPHVLAYCLINSLPEDPALDLSIFIGGGFRDMTRTAKSNPNMWSEILFENTECVRDACAQFANELNAINKALETNDRKAVTEIFQRANVMRLGLKLPGEENIE